MLAEPTSQIMKQKQGQSKLHFTAYRTSSHRRKKEVDDIVTFKSVLEALKMKTARTRQLENFLALLEMLLLTTTST